MDSNVQWVRIFDIIDSNKHHKGFIIYKVISMLYPEKCPETITKLTVWKRYNDFKKLYKEMKVLHGKYKIEDKFPNLPRGSFFKKYDKQALLQKKESALSLLEYIGSHHQLFTSIEFVKFFETSYTPVDHLSSNINAIKSDLNLPDDPEFIRNSDDEQIISDTDSVTTVSSVSLLTDLMDFSLTSTSGQPTWKLSLKLPNTQTLPNIDDNVSTCTIESLTLLDGQIYCSPSRSLDSDEVYVQYIIDASVHIKIAEDLERAKKYEESFVAYKAAIDILLKHGSNEENYDRKRMVKYKTEKYLLRAEKLYNMYLAPEMKTLKTIFEQTKEVNGIKKPVMSELYKYNVLRIIGSGMLVVHSDSQKIFYVKVIHKTMKFLDDYLILPENVPYMVQLHNYYNCDNAFFLVLEYVNGLVLSDYLLKFKTKSEKDKVVDNIFDEVHNSVISDDESEKSFSDLINDYTSRRNNSDDSDDSFVKITKDDILPSQLKNLIDESLRECHTTTLDHSSILISPESDTSGWKDSTRASLDIDLEHSNNIPDSEIVKWTAQLILALEKLHILGITCKDLRSYNLIIDEKGDLHLTFMCNVKELCDFFNNSKDLNLAPEVHGIGPVGQEADWWSLGAILYEILVGVKLSDIHPQYFSGSTFLKVPKYVSPEGRSLLRQLLVYEPKDRLGAGPHGIANLKSHPFFKEVNWNELLQAFSEI